MRTTAHLQRRLPDKAEHLALILGAVVSWSLIALLFYFATSKVSILVSILIGPCVLLLTYFAFGGDIPLKFRQKGYRRPMLVPIVFGISFVAAFIVDHFSGLAFD